MSTYLRRALPATLVVGGLALAVGGAVAGAGEQTLPAALLLVVSGGVTHLYVHLNRPRGPASLLPPAPGAPPPTVPSQRTADSTLVAAPRTGPVEGPRGYRSVGGVPARPYVAPSDGAQRAGLQHRVLPHDGLPHQRRPSAGS